VCAQTVDDQTMRIHIPESGKGKFSKFIFSQIGFCAGSISNHLNRTGAVVPDAILTRISYIQNNSVAAPQRVKNFNVFQIATPLQVEERLVVSKGDNKI